MVEYPVNSHRTEIMVSVIILNYNGREHLEVCLSSLRDLVYPKEQLEIIIVDNASTDDSVDFVQSRFPEAVIIQNEVNLGFSKAANRGAANAKGEYLAFLNNDMRVDKNWLSILVETARAGNGLACVGSTVLNWDGTAIDFVGRSDDPFCLAYEGIDKSSLASPPTGPHFPALFVSGGASRFLQDFVLVRYDTWLQTSVVLVELGFRPECSLRDGLKQYVKWLIEQGPIPEYFANAERELQSAGVIRSAT